MAIWRLLSLVKPVLRSAYTDTAVIVEDPRAARPYLFSDGQNIYNRVVLVCTVRIYLPLFSTVVPAGTTVENKGK